MSLDSQVSHRELVAVLSGKNPLFNPHHLSSGLEHVHPLTIETYHRRFEISTQLNFPTVYFLMCNLASLAKNEQHQNMREVYSALVKRTESIDKTYGIESITSVSEHKVLNYLDTLCYYADIERASVRRAESLSQTQIQELAQNLYLTPIRKFFRETFPNHWPRYAN